MNLEVGSIYGKIQVIAMLGKIGKHDFALVRCDCGEIKAKNAIYIKVGKTKSCGCLQKQKRSSGNVVHGLHTKYKREHKSWSEMKQRCYGSSDWKKKFYKEKGIIVYEPWLTDFVAFFNYMGPKPVGLELDRIDNDGSYVPGNVRWASKTQNSRNRSISVYVTYKGKRLHLMEYCEITGVPYKLAYNWATQRPHLIESERHIKRASNRAMDRAAS